MAPAEEDAIPLRWDNFRVGTPWNEERISTFKEIYPNVTIEFRPDPRCTAEQLRQDVRLPCRWRFGELCAFHLLPTSTSWRAIDKNIIMPIDDLIAAHATDLAQGSWACKSTRASNTVCPVGVGPGKTQSSPMRLTSKAEGIELPAVDSRETSMATIAEWVQSFYKEGERFGLNIGHGEGNVVTLTRAFGGDLINADGTQCTLVDNPGSVEALRGPTSWQSKTRYCPHRGHWRMLNLPKSRAS